jgi:hypothetical protein
VDADTTPDLDVQELARDALSCAPADLELGGDLAGGDEERVGHDSTTLNSTTHTHGLAAHEFGFHPLISFQR